MKNFTSLLPWATKLFTAALLLNTTALNAQQFVMDSLFGTNGEVYSSFTAGQGFTTNILKQPDGKLIVCGNTHGGANEFWNNMFRVDACGKVDSAFGINGLVIHKFDQRNIGLSYLLKDDGKIMAVGIQSISNAGSAHCPFIARYNADGTPDTTFATLGSNKILNSGTDRFTAIFKANDSKWLCTDFNILYRFDSLGVVDSTFGINGKVSIPAPYNGYEGSAYVMRSDNKIVYASRQNFGGGYQNMYICFDTLGVVDSTFGSNGLAVEGNYITGPSPQLLLQSNDKVIAVAPNSTQTDIIAARYNTNGSLDTTFGVNGFVSVPGETLQYLSALDNDNFLIGREMGGSPMRFYKITANGIIDSTFTLNGSVYYQFDNNVAERPNLGLLESNGDLIMATCANGVSPRMAFVKFALNSAVPHITQNFTTLNSNVSASGVSFQWYLNGVAISGATDSTYIFNQNGVYSVEVTTSNGCNSLLDSITVINAGINTVTQLEGVTFYPNPVADELTINNITSKEIIACIFEVSGKLISNQSVRSGKNAIATKGLAKGFYLLELKSDDGVMRSKIIKN